MLARPESATYLSDLRQEILREVTGRGLDAADGGELYSVEGTLPGRVYAGLRPQLVADGERSRWWVPVLDGTERLGLLRGSLDDGADLGQFQTLASLVGMLIVSKQPSSDAAARLSRTQTMNVAAELQWNLTPPRSFANKDVVISAAMEPAYEIGGDAFDYALAGDQVHLGIFDAVVQGKDHPDTLTACTNLATSYARTGRTAEAIGIEERGVADCARLLGGEHPDTLTARANLAEFYARAGRTGKAIVLLEKVVADRERLLGENHPDTLTARANLASSYVQAGRFSEAVVLLEKVVADRERLLGEDHPRTVAARSKLAGLIRAVGANQRGHRPRRGDGR
ncbi:tetratricopeptide repeat protein [Streptomyces rochei]|uniref:tetratricopeptide repeat protein n=1 Tax=Streptomyces rochei TaxID=1928 RepID=UPI0013B9D3D3|nr:tetratricopeptide repeat protein [Streptomyces rochei]NEC70999.1 tetratricopeptide repeat protein [Streptomyces rochei]